MVFAEILLHNPLCVSACMFCCLNSSEMISWLYCYQPKLVGDARCSKANCPRILLWHKGNYFEPRNAHPINESLFESVVPLIRPLLEILTKSQNLHQTQYHPGIRYPSSFWNPRYVVPTTTCGANVSLQYSSSSTKTQLRQHSLVAPECKPHRFCRIMSRNWTFHQALDRIHKCN